MRRGRLDDNRPMRDFWWFARRLFRRKREVALLLLGATVSAGGLGAGLLGLGPILRIILIENGSLRSMAEGAVERHAWLQFIPSGLIESLPTQPYPGVMLAMVGLAILTIVGASANYMHQMVSMTICARTVAQVRLEVFQHAIHLPLGEVNRQGPTEFTSRVLRDTSDLRGGFESLTSKTLAQVTKGLAAFIAAMIFDWRLVLVSLVVGPLLGVVLRKTGKSIRRGSRGSLEAGELLLRSTNESMQGLRAVKTASAEREAVRRFNRANHEALVQELRMRRARSLAAPLIEMLTVFAAMVLAIVAARQILAGELAFDRFVLSLGSLAVAAGSLRPLTGFIHEIQAASAPATRLRAMLSVVREDTNEWRKPILQPHVREIAFESVVFRYPGSDHRALDGVDVTFDHGSRVAIVGPNGCGKTTLLSLLTRLFEPESGRVTVDGVDLRTVNVRSIRSQIGVVSQESILVKGTIADNVRFGLRSATNDAVIEALRRAHAWNFVERLSGGIHAIVGEQGSSLSGGQRQRIAIARAVLRNPAILVMDEATSQIDAESEEQINDAIADFGAGRTVVVIAHRLSTVLACERIVVMDHGRVIDTGRHDELLGRCDLYRRLAQAQLTEAG
ncbi:MAG: ABC transporter ATP-binding protein [Planctomycetes bacterium]|nr:ABC transporter ATP-binding protein [Planctomycetota bacterium]